MIRQLAYPNRRDAQRLGDIGSAHGMAASTSYPSAGMHERTGHRTRGRLVSRPSYERDRGRHEQGRLEASAWAEAI